MAQLFKVPLLLTPQPEGGYVVTSPVLPELITEGDTADEAVRNVADALVAVRELYEDLGRALPAGLMVDPPGAPIQFEFLTVA